MPTCALSSVWSQVLGVALQADGRGTQPARFRPLILQISLGRGRSVPFAGGDQGARRHGRDARPGRQARRQSASPSRASSGSSMTTPMRWA
jgi:hypothetical protein